MLQVKNVSFNYRRGKKEVLHDFSLSMGKGGVYGLLGRNGAGKSTLLYLMSGLLIPKKRRSDIPQCQCSSPPAGYSPRYVPGT